jgi:squalene-associated FAD-dependent desaturase
MANVHIIGAGLAGLAAGVKLAGSGQRIFLYEMAPQAGGRCRSFHDATLGRTIDNGNHVILGANVHALEYILAIGSADTFLHRASPTYAYADLTNGERFAWQPPRLLPGVRLRHYADLFRLMRASDHKTVADCFDTASPLYRRLIEPFCVSALNTAPAFASAALLRHVLWLVAKKGSAGMRYWLPGRSLSESLIDPALALLRKAGAEIALGCAVRALEWEDTKVAALQLADQRVTTAGDSVILAAPPAAVAKLFPAATVPTAYNAIVNGHFLCPGVGWPEGQDFVAVLGGTAEWIFYRDGIFSTTTSAANALAEENNATIAKRLWADICNVLGLSLPLPAHRIINEKRATHAATPAHCATAGQQTVYGNLILAGDYTEPTLPATIDGAVKSGFGAAKQTWTL